MKLNDICVSLEGIGTEKNVLYTNEEMIENLDKLQRALACSIFAATHVECTRAKEIMAGIKRMAIAHGMDTTPEYQRLNANMNQLGYTIGSLIKGRNGERNTEKALQLLELDKNVRILYNVAIQAEDAQTEYDAIILAPYGVFVVEVKNYNEDMRITESGMFERLTNPDFQYNLGGRMNCKEYLLRKTLGDLLPAANYHSILLYANEYSKLVDDYGRIQVCFRNTIVQDVKKYDDGQAVFSQDQLTAMEHTLRSIHTPKRYACKVDCTAIKEDFAYLMGKMAPTDETDDAVCAEVTMSDVLPDIPMEEVVKHFSWKEFWYGMGAGATIVGLVCAVFKMTNSKATRA